MANYLRERSAGEILRGTIKIYLQNFLQLCGMYLLPTFPFLMLKLKVMGNRHAGYFYFLWITMWALVTPFATAMLTVGVSDICVGNPPNIIRSLRWVVGTILGKLVLTNLFMFVIMIAAFIPWILTVYLPRVPSFFPWLTFLGATILILLFLVWWMFVPTVVVLERTVGCTALKRSRVLGKGFYIRNCGVVLLLYLPSLILGWLIFGTLQISDNDILRMLGVALEGALAPVVLIATVLLYYELRVRSEGYDLTMLGQDLKR